MSLIDTQGNTINSLVSDIEVLSKAVDAVLGPLIEKHIEQKKAEMIKNQTDISAIQ